MLRPIVGNRLRGMSLLTQGPLPPPWVPTGAKAYANFVTGQYWLGGEVVTQADFITETRAGTAWGLSTNAVETFGANAVRITDLGLWNEGAATNELSRSDASSLGNAQWTNTLTAAGGGALPGTLTGGFADCRELGSSSIQRLLKATSAAISVGNTVSFATIQKQAERYVGIRTNMVATVNRNIGFDLDTLTVTFASTGLSGGIIKYGNNYVIYVTAVGTITSPAWSVFVQNTAIVDDTIPAFTGDVNEGVKFANLDVRAAADGIGSPILNPGTGTASRAADAYVTPLSGPGSYPVTFVFDNGTTQQFAGISAGNYAYPTNLNRPLVTEFVWGNV